MHRPVSPEMLTRPALGQTCIILSYGGRTCLSASRVIWPSLSGNLTVKSKIMSPLFSGHLDRGRPSPAIRFFIPGLTTSLEVTVMVRPSRVGAFTVHPHNACREWKTKVIGQTKPLMFSKVLNHWQLLSKYLRSFLTSPFTYVSE